MGSPEFAASSLRYLLDNAVTVVGVVTQPDRPKGRGRKLSPTPVKEAALSQGIPVVTPERLDDKNFIGFLQAFEAPVTFGCDLFDAAACLGRRRPPHRNKVQVHPQPVATQTHPTEADRKLRRQPSYEPVRVRGK